MGTSKKIILGFIHLFLAIQLTLPLSYYTCRSDRNDERFAWRMFSSVRMLRCSATLTIGEKRQPARLSAVFHEAWITLTKRGRQEIVVAMAKELCARNPGQEVRAQLICTRVDGQRETIGSGWNLCEVDDL